MQLRKWQEALELLSQIKEDIEDYDDYEELKEPYKPENLEKVEKKMLEHDQKFDLLIRTNLPPSEGIFYDGQIFDAWEFVSA